MKRLLLSFLLLLPLASPAQADLVLRQSTASQAVMIGPFVDSTDGNTEETGLTIANTDVRLSKNGATGVAKNSGGCTHDTGFTSFYICTFDATDTNTVGRLQVKVHVSGALPVYHEFQVAEEAVYDACCAASAAPLTATDVWAAATRTLTALDEDTTTLDLNATAVGSVAGAVGSVTASVTVGTNNDKTGYTLSTTGLNAIRDLTVEDQGGAGNLSLACVLSAIMAAVAGDVATTGGNSTFEDPSGTETRVASVVVSAGNRTTTITCPTL